jgi:hypothetical protein
MVQIQTWDHAGKVQETSALCVSDEIAELGVTCTDASSMGENYVTFPLKTDSAEAVSNVISACAAEDPPTEYQHLTIGEQMYDQFARGTALAKSTTACNSIVMGAKKVDSSVYHSNANSHPPTESLCYTAVNGKDNKYMMPKCSHGEAGEQQAMLGQQYCIALLSHSLNLQDFPYQAYSPVLDTSILTSSQTNNTVCMIAKVPPDFDGCHYMVEPEYAEVFARSIGAADLPIDQNELDYWDDDMHLLAAVMDTEPQCEDFPNYVGGVSIASLGMCSCLLLAVLLVRTK